MSANMLNVGRVLITSVIHRSPIRPARRRPWGVHAAHQISGRGFCTGFGVTLMFSNV